MLHEKTPDAFERQMREIERLRQIVRKYRAEKLSELLIPAELEAEGINEDDLVKKFNAQTEKIIYGDTDA